VTIRPVVVGCLAIFTIITPSRGFKIELIRKNAQSPERVFELWQGENRFALSPVGLKKYSLDFKGDEISQTPPGNVEELKLENAAAQGGIAMMEREMAELMEVRSTLAGRRAALREKLAWLEANSRLDGTGDLAELKETFGVDEEIISSYLQEPEGEDVMKLVEDVRRGITKIEDRIREFVAHRGQKTTDIEKSLRIGG
jgi:predicted nuclease with TOPRIM domain